ncbi:hypothetical protein [Flavobacterium aquiphilum]|uniref:hypothetical protein n=1 Tax=Flavobacterium aquiphilum TaxID=3003261 RepID=UPI0024805F29|nr:hypothetical protein [Flavobacterium aquiphilum]
MSRPLVEITGFKELQEKLKLLSNDKDKKKEILLILRQVANPTIKAVKSFVPVSKKAHKARGKLIQPRNLEKSIGTITGKQENPTILVGPRVKGNNNGWYGHMVDQGHNIYQNPLNANKYHKKGVLKGRSKSVLSRVTHKRVGVISSRVDGVNFMKEGFNVTNAQVTADAEKRITAFIQRRIDKLSTNV